MGRAMTQEDRGHFGRLAKKFANQPRLADTGLADNMDDQSFARPHPGEGRRQCSEFVPAPDEL